MRIPENEWPARLSASDPERAKALEELRQLLFKGVKSGLDGRAGNDDAFIEDVVQVSLVRILDKLNTFQGRSKFSTWALSIALRVAFAELRKKHWKNVPFDALADGDVKAEFPDTSPSTPYGNISRKNFINLMYHLIRTKLTERQRNVLTAELHGLPQDEIAARMGGTRNSVYKAGHDARKALKRELEAAGHGAEAFRDIFNDSTEGASQ